MPLPKTKSSALFSNSFFIFIIRFFPSLANLLVVIGYSHYLSQAAYGHYQGFWIQLNIIYPLACFGIHVLIITYSPDHILAIARKISAKSYVAFVLWIGGLSALFAMLQFGNAANAFLVPFIFILAFSVNAILESFLVVCRNYMTLVISNILYSAAFCFVHWQVIHLAWSGSGLSEPPIHLLFFYLLIITLMRFAVYLWATLTNIRSVVVNANTAINVTKIRSLWLHLGFYDVTQVFFNWIDKFIIALLLTAPVSAIYYNGAQTIPFLPLLLSAAGSAVLMQLAAEDKHDETENIILFMNRSGRLLSCIVFPVFFYLLFFRYELLLALFGQKYLPAVPIFALSVLVLPVKAYSFTTILQRMHKGNIINIGSVADLVLACSLMYPLYLWLGLPGVALSFVISTYLQAFFYLHHSARLLNTNPLTLIPYVNWLVKLIVFATLFIAIHYAVNLYFTGWIPLILGGVAMTIMIGASLLIEYKKKGTHGGS